ncbi:hypothetical protein SB2_25525 [Methylobacterium radiotolerans]|nr:hypothetical protein SB3_28250 [Methylobacterium radiotolerans]KTS44098.1 hypothetical protein SB2_25525 [Methylobacterium radiotolerans]
MCYLNSIADDMPARKAAEPKPAINSLLREADFVSRDAGNAIRMLEAYRNDEAGWPPSVRRMHVAAALNSAEAWLKSLREIEAEVLPVRSLPAVVSPAGVA